MVQSRWNHPEIGHISGPPSEWWLQGHRDPVPNSHPAGEPHPSRPFFCLPLKSWLMYRWFIDYV
jgi:hypothetical protein